MGLTGQLGRLALEKRAGSCKPEAWAFDRARAGHWDTAIKGSSTLQAAFASTVPDRLGLVQLGTRSGYIVGSAMHV